MQLYRDHLSFLTGDAVQVNGRHLTQGEILEYNGILCLDCNLGPGWHLPAETDVYSISPLGNSRGNQNSNFIYFTSILSNSIVRPKSDSLICLAPGVRQLKQNNSNLSFCPDTNSCSST